MTRLFVPFSIRFAAVGIFALLTAGSLLTPAFSSDDLDSDGPYFSETDGLDRPMPEALNYMINAGATDATFRSALTPAPVQAPQKRPSFLSRLFHRAKKQVSLPIEQVQKIPQQPPSPPKETQASQYAVLRLPVMVSFNEKSLPAGIYGVQVTENSLTKQLNLAIQLQSRTLLEVPAFISKLPSPMTPVAMIQNASEEHVSSVSGDSLELEFLDNGQQIVLLYQQAGGNRALQSFPLDVMSY